MLDQYQQAPSVIDFQTQSPFMQGFTIPLLKDDDNQGLLIHSQQSKAKSWRLTFKNFD